MKYIFFDTEDFLCYDVDYRNLKEIKSHVFEMEVKPDDLIEKECYSCKYNDIIEKNNIVMDYCLKKKHTILLEDSCDYWEIFNK